MLGLIPLRSLGACAVLLSVLLGTACLLILAPPAPAAARWALPVAAPAASPAQAGFGTIKGRLVWGGSELPRPEAIEKIEKDVEVCKAKPLFKRGLLVDPATKGIAHAFVYLFQPQGSNPEAVKALVARQPKVEIDQKNCEFLPYTTALHQDQELVFKSSDPVAHNVRYSGFANPAKNVNLPPNGQLEVKLKADRFPMPLNCDFHNWMTGYIMVFDHPFFTTTAADGSFELSGVPAGEQRLVVSMPERVGYVTENLARGKPITVTAGGVTDVGLIVLDPGKVKSPSAAP